MRSPPLGQRSKPTWCPNLIPQLGKRPNQHYRPLLTLQFGRHCYNSRPNSWMMHISAIHGTWSLPPAHTSWLNLESELCTKWLLCTFAGIRNILKITNRLATMMCTLFLLKGGVPTSHYALFIQYLEQQKVLRTRALLLSFESIQVLLSETALLFWLGPSSNSCYISSSMGSMGPPTNSK
jgi:hypothetical protein